MHVRLPAVALRPLERGPGHLHRAGHPGEPVPLWVAVDEPRHHHHRDAQLGRVRRVRHRAPQDAQRRQRARAHAHAVGAAPHGQRDHQPHLALGRPRGVHAVRCARAAATGRALPAREHGPHARLEAARHPKRPERPSLQAARPRARARRPTARRALRRAQPSAPLPLVPRGGRVREQRAPAGRLQHRAARRRAVARRRRRARHADGHGQEHEPRELQKRRVRHGLRGAQAVRRRALQLHRGAAAYFERRHRCA